MRARRLLVVGVAAVAAFAGDALAGMATLQFNANDVFNYATVDDTRLNQLGTARLVWDSPTGRNYLTYNDGTRDPGATPAQDLQSVQNILEYTASAGYQGVSHVQLWLAGNAGMWGERILQMPGSTLTVSVNGEFGWTVNTTPSGSYQIVHFNTELGGDPLINQNALSPDFHPAQQWWTVTGDFYVDQNGNSVYDAGDTDLVIGNQYAIWFNAALNNWHVVDAYGNDTWGGPDIQGSLFATAVPAPGALLLGGIGAGLIGWMRRRKAL